MKKGIIFLFVVVLLSIFVVISISFTQISQQNHRLTQNRFIHIKARTLAHSGFEYALSHINDISSQNSSLDIPIGEGTYQPQGDQASLRLSELNGKININDGIQAGQINELLNSLYQSDKLDPWPASYSQSQGMELGSIDQSAFINLRLRRLLNAYGDVHRFIDHVFDDDPSHCNEPSFYRRALPTPAYSVGKPITSTELFSLEFESIEEFEAYDGIFGSSDGIPLLPMDGKKSVTLNEYNNGLGDRIIEARPQNGYSDLNQIKDVVNSWSADFGVSLSQTYLQEKTFYDLVTYDLTINSYEDNQLFRYESIKFHDPQLPYPGNVRLSRTSTLIDFSRYFDFGNQNNNYGWTQHSVSLINLNSTRFFVRAAVFYAPTNVALICEGAQTVSPYYGDQDTANYGNDFFDETTALESSFSIPLYGTAPLVFNQNLATLENGLALDDVGNPIGRSSHFMSLRDAMYLANQYETYLKTNEILNFDDFRNFLIWHESQTTDNFPCYERAHPVDHYQKISDKEDINFGGLFYVSEFNQSSECVQDYGSRILPHILSCIRRIPSYFDAPFALQSPYIVLKPDTTNELYKNGSLLMEQSMRKIEDFVVRITHPKVCFLSHGFYEIISLGQIKNHDDQVVASTQLHAEAQVFDTRYYRTQKDFIDLTDNETHQSIKIGPEFIQVPPLPPPAVQPSEHLGFVGLKDFDRDHLLNDLITSFSPHIAMNFNPDDPLDNNNGLSNTSQEDISPQPQFENDPWHQAIDTRALDHFNKSAVEGSDQPVMLSRGLVSYDRCDLSPFNGLYFHSFLHNPFTKITVLGGYQNYAFRDSLYFRLDDWLDPTSEPIGQSLSSGVMTFWFKMPSTYDYPHPLSKYTIDEVMPRCFSRVLVQLNLWESFTHESNNPLMYRPITLTVGLKKIPEKGMTLFARYDSGGPSHVQTPGYESYGFTGTLINGIIYNQLIPSVYQPGALEQYDYLGFYCETTRSGFSNDYETYRSAAYRSSEIHVVFDNKIDNGPGSWHRAGAGWNLRWPGGNQLTSHNQLWIKLYDHSNQEISLDPLTENFSIHQDYMSASYAIDPSGQQNPLELDPLTPGAPLHYPGGDMQTGGGLGFMLPFDSSMVLSLGEAHGCQLTQNFPVLKGTGSFDSIGHYYPYWRLNSTIDNFRLSMGPSDPNKQVFPSEYLDPDNFIYSTNHILEAMRYNVTRTGWHNMPNNTYAEPAWVINPKLTKKTRLLSIGTRVYYPPDENNNVPYVRLSAFDNRGEIKPLTKMSLNEQELFYPGYVTESLQENPLRLKLQYMAHKPKLNGNQSDIGDPLVYYGDDHCTNIPWIKEISIRYVDQHFPMIHSLTTKDRE